MAIAPVVRVYIICGQAPGLCIASNYHFAMQVIIYYFPLYNRVREYILWYTISVLEGIEIEHKIF